MGGSVGDEGWGMRDGGWGMGDGMGDGMGWGMANGMLIRHASTSSPPVLKMCSQKAFSLGKPMNLVYYADETYAHATTPAGSKYSWSQARPRHR